MTDYLEPLELRRIAKRLGPDSEKWEQISGALITHRELGTGCLARVRNASPKRHLFEIDIEFPGNGVRHFSLLELLNNPPFSTIQPTREHSAMPDIANVLSNIERARRLDKKELEHKRLVEGIDRGHLEQLLSFIVGNLSMAGLASSGPKASLTDYAKVFRQLLTTWKFPNSKFQTDDDVRFFVVLARLELGQLPNDAGLDLIDRHGSYQLAQVLSQIRDNETEYARRHDPIILTTISSLWRTLRRPDFALRATDKVFDTDQRPLLSMPRDVEAMLLNTRGAVYRELHMLQSARDCAERSIKIMPNQRHVYNMLSAIYRQLGDTKAAIRTMELANALPPDIEANK